LYATAFILLLALPLGIGHIGGRTLTLEDAGIGSTMYFLPWKLNAVGCID